LACLEQGGRKAKPIADSREARKDLMGVGSKEKVQQGDKKTRRGNLTEKKRALSGRPETAPELTQTVKTTAKKKTSKTEKPSKGRRNQPTHPIKGDTRDLNVRRWVAS